MRVGRPVGVAHAAALWQADPQGRTLLDGSGFISFHSYDGGAIDPEIAGIPAHTHQPVVHEAKGWPTGPPCADPTFSAAPTAALPPPRGLSTPGLAAGMFCSTVG